MCGRQGPRSIMLDELPEGHPEAVVVVRPRCKQITGCNGQTPFCEKSPDGDLTSKPPLDVTVQYGGAGHHSRQDWSGFDMHEHIAAVSHHHCVLASDGTGECHRSRRRHGARWTGGRNVAQAVRPPGTGGPKGGREELGGSGW